MVHMGKTVTARAVSARLGHVTMKMADVRVDVRLGIKAQFVMKVSLIYIIFTVCFMIGIYVNSSRFYYMPPCKAYKLLTGHLSTNQPELKVDSRNDIAIAVDSGAKQQIKCASGCAAGYKGAICNES